MHIYGHLGQVAPSNAPTNGANGTTKQRLTNLEKIALVSTILSATSLVYTIWSHQNVRTTEE